MTHPLYEVLGARVRAAHPDVDVSSVRIVGPLKHAGALLDLLVEPVIEASGLGPAEFDVLLHLRYGKAPVIAREMAARMSRSPAAVSKVLGKLERRGFVERTANATDRRAALVQLTGAGTAAIERAIPPRFTFESQLVEALGERASEVEAALRALVAALREVQHSGRQPDAAPSASATASSADST